MSSPSQQEITELLVAWRNGDKAALDKMMEVVYDELHRRARYFMRRERPARSLQTSVLFNELTDLAAVFPLKCQIIELRSYGGLTNDDIAEVQGDFYLDRL